MKKMNKLPLLGILLAFAMTVSAGTVRIKTAKPVGEKINIAVNISVPLTLTWGDGTSETITSTGMLQTITVKNASLSISSDKAITALYLAENELTELVLTGMSDLTTLVCSDNKLKELNLANCSSLVSLDCQNNNISTLSVGSTNMVDMNIANNQLTQTGLRSVANLVSLVCANNKLTAVNYIGSMTNLRTLFAQGNKISSITPSKSTGLRDVLLSDNELKTFNVKALVNLENLWVSNNQIDALDFSDNTKLVGLVADGNKLSSITWNNGVKSTFAYVDLTGNSLYFPSLPTVYNPSKEIWTVDGAIGEQEPILLFSDMDVNTQTDNIRTYLSRNGWNATLTTDLVLHNASGQELVQGEDYDYSSYRFTFLKGNSGVVISATSKNYPGLTLKTQPFNIIDPTGIENLTPTLSESEGDIYDLSGRQIVNSQLSNRKLNKGIYIVNGKKVVVR